MKLCNLCLAAVVAIMCCPAFSFSAPANPCESPNSTPEDKACAAQQLDDQEKILNAAYKRALAVARSTPSPARSSHSPRELLIKAQRKWIEFRQLDCEAQESVYEGGSIADKMYLDCLTEHAKQRIKELDPVNWEGG